MKINKIISKNLILYFGIYSILFIALYCLMPSSFDAYFSLLNIFVSTTIFIFSTYILYRIVNKKNCTHKDCDKIYFICTNIPFIIYLINILISCLLIILYREFLVIITSLLNIFASTVFYIFSDDYYNTILNYSEKVLRPYTTSILNKKINHIPFATCLIMKTVPLLIIPMFFSLCVSDFNISSITFIIGLTTICILSIIYIAVQTYNNVIGIKYSHNLYDLQFKINIERQIYSNNISNLQEINYKELKKERLSSIEIIRRTVDAKDTYTRGHSDRVSAYCVIIGKKLGLSNEDLEILKIGGLLHDIGKIGIPDKILLKEGKLTNEEYEEIKKHPHIGAHILENSGIFENVISIILHHHEKYDGTGYPDNLKGEEIPFFARIVAIADAFDAMTSKRIYRNSLSLDIVKQEFKKCSGTQFDPKLLTVFLDILNNDYEKISYIQDNPINR